MQILALHGFTGCGQDFECLKAYTGSEIQWAAHDLAGHGQRASHQADDFSFHASVTEIDALIDSQPEKPLLLGYSMGARVALAYAIQNASKLKGLVLVSGTPGIQSDLERQKRAQADTELANFTTQNGVEPFLENWLQRPLIQSQNNIPDSILAPMIARRQQNTPKGLASSLIGMGTGNMPSLWSQLKAITCPTCLVSGEQDQKFSEIASRMHPQISQSRHVIIPNAGHAAHLENIDAFCQELKQFTGLL